MTEKINSVDIWKGIKKSDFDEGVKKGLITILGQEYDREYLDKIESLAIHEGDELDLSIPLVYTPLNGCGSIPFRQMLNDRGFTNWKIVPEQENPDPDFTTVGYPNPEDPKAFRLSEEYGKKFGAELLMATDPDADRFAIEIRDDNGNYIPLNGNQTGYLLVNYILEGHKSAGTLPANGAMVKSIVTSSLSSIIAEDYGVKMFETLTGFKNISGKVPYLHDHGLKYLFGYEESVGYAACEDIRDKDGISAGMLVAEAAAYYRKQGKTLFDVLGQIFEKYGYFAEDEPNIVLEGIEGGKRIERMMKYFRENIPSEVAGIKVSKVIDYINGYEDIPKQNALRLFLENDSWFAIRPSGTEPKIKFYFYSKQNCAEEAAKVNGQIKEEILNLINAVE
jgi:phosphoglucomutase